MSKTYICSYGRTPIGSFLGSLKSFSAPKLASKVIKNILNNNSIDSALIDEVIMGNVLSAGIGQAPARQASIYSGLSSSTKCLTVNKVCGSGLKSIMIGDQSIQLKDSEIVIAGGMESMSQAPYLDKYARQGAKFGHTELIDSILNDGLWDPYNDIPMGLCAEKLNKEESYSREEQDQYAITSYQRSLKSIEEDLFVNEIVPIQITSKKGTKVIDQDEEPLRFNKDRTLSLNPAFDKNGTITAANASSLNDGAAAVLLCSKNKMESLKLTPQAKIVSHVSIATEPIDFTKAPVKAIEVLLKKTELSINDIDLFEINEAFSCVPIYAIKKLGIPIEKINILGGAVSLGHPIGASGARILVTLLNALKINNKKYGIASICIGGGEACAILIENIDE